MRRTYGGGSKKAPQSASSTTSIGSESTSTRRPRSSDPFSPFIPSDRKRGVKRQQERKRNFVGIFINSSIHQSLIYRLNVI
jgi:hypothetical protein